MTTTPDREDRRTAVLHALLADLRAENAELDALVAGLPAEAWATPTPAEGWTVAHQIAHLAWTDRWAVLSADCADDPERFHAPLREALTAAEAAGREATDIGADEGAAQPPERLLAEWREARDGAAAALSAAPADRKLPWFGPPMKPASMVTSRLMETWAHGQDVADALGAVRTPTARLRHIAHLAHATVGWSFQVHRQTPPAVPVRFALTAPGGESWHFGPADAENVVTGPALDLCLLATRRRHPDDLDLTAHGEAAIAWLGVAQAFAGAPGPGRRPSA
ncbi:TIGR03084 family metal-binding protein [Phaeacidiphilus oryzae]|uniref:TIGR03084 family metal-binding protein n=1 Tax=Phaeacidiphilus oryzae TaxID=348818 RepID=UPI0006892928|nr:TIGR03084 family metal-binding protein [Phaeacidiphilus oryzae]